jgi:4-hydroxybenzoate polyprenyltransferase
MVKIPGHTISLLRLIRWPNLLIVALTQVLIRICIISPVLHRMNMEPLLPRALFALLVIGTVCITAGGYIINDYFDRKIDRINKPDEMIVGTHIYPRQAMAYHIMFSVVGLICGVYVSLRIHELYLSLVFFIVSGLLWFYSTTYKRQLLLGNIIVALLTALVPFIVLLFELPLIGREFGSQASEITRILIMWVAGFSLFAFLLNLLREIIKDTEDLEGDSAYGKQTIPVIWGVNAARWISLALIIIVMALIVLVWIFFLRDYITLIYFLLLIAVPLMLAAVMLIKGDGKPLYHKAGNIIKLVMLSGLCYMIVANMLMKYL